MKSLRNIVTVLLISQFISGCIAIISPGYSEFKQERVIVIYEPCPIPIPVPIPIKRPAPIIVQPIEKPKIEKYRKPEEERSREREKPVVSRNTDERVRDSGERRGK